MSSLFTALNTARTGLFAQQAGLAVTGNNIANANTVGYTRQTAVLQQLPNGGVQMIGSLRMRDEFVQTRLYNSNGQLAGAQTLAQNLSQIESALGALDAGGVGPSLQEFFNAFQDLSQQPGAAAQREEVQGKTNQLTSAFDSVASQLRQLRTQIDRQVVDQVSTVNNLSKQIADLNGKIASSPQNSDLAVDPGFSSLLDQRDNLVNQLSQIVPVKTIKDSNGSLTLFVGDQPLIEGSNARSLTVQVDPSNDGMHDVIIGGLGTGVSVGGKLQSGTLAALIQSRDSEAGSALDAIDRLAAKLARDVNVQHRAGTGLNGSTGVNFFDGEAAVSTGGSQNTGGAQTTAATITDDSQLTFDDYQIKFTGAGQYDVIDTSSGATLSAGNAYTSGSPIVFDGMSITISNATGTPAAGDVFNVNSYAGASQNIKLAAAIVNDPRSIAAGNTTATGDNTNVLQILALRNQQTMGQPASQTYEDYFNNVGVRQGLATAAAQQALTDASTVNSQLVSLADSQSGVSLDEEATNLIQYQRAFQASSRVISATDELLQSLIQMI